ncbi:MAG: hypothetical protein AAB373_00050 [Patescibacteria group bacterium]
MADTNQNIAVGQINPLDQSSLQKGDESNILKNIVSNETGENQNILEDAPEIDQTLLEEIEPPKSILLLILKICFGVFCAAGVASLAFFGSQLTAKLDFITSRFDLPNISNELSSTNNEIINLQTSINLNRFLHLKGVLDEFGYIGDDFLTNYEISNSQTVSSTDRAESKADLVKLRAQLKDNFLEARGLISENIAAPLIDINFQDTAQLDVLFIDKLKSAINEKATLLAKSTDEKAKRDHRNYTQILSLISNKELKKSMISTDLDSLSDKELYEFVKKLNTLVVNDITTIEKIKEKRIRWSDIINEIDLTTMAVDSQYNEDFYDELGGIRYTGYDFDTEKRSISIVGETKRFDTNNFTMIANLIDAINKSNLFENADMRSLSKSGSLADGYVAIVKLTFKLQEGKNSAQPADESLEIDALPDFVNN